MGAGEFRCCSSHHFCLDGYFLKEIFIVKVLDCQSRRPLISELGRKGGELELSLAFRFCTPIARSSAVTIPSCSRPPRPTPDPRRGRGQLASPRGDWARTRAVHSTCAENERVPATRPAGADGSEGQTANLYPAEESGPEPARGSATAPPPGGVPSGTPAPAGGPCRPGPDRVRQAARRSRRARRRRRPLPARRPRPRGLAAPRRRGGAGRAGAELAAR